MKYTVIIEKGRESGFVAYAPALKGCVSQGKTKAEARKNIKEAIETYIDALDIKLIQRRKDEPSRLLKEYMNNKK